MGGDGRRAEGLPVSLKVKNTFIDVNSSFVEDDADDAAFLQTSLRKRQVSEPVPSIQRQISGGPFYRAEARSPVTGVLPTDGLLEEEELEGDELDELDELEDREEPETEKDPCWVLGRQETEQAWPTMGPTRQETEQCWLAWGPSGAAGAALGQAEPMLVHPKGESSAVGMWMYSMPGMEGSQPAQHPGLALADGGLQHAALAALGPSAWPALASPYSVNGCEGGALGEVGGVPAEPLPALEPSPAMDGLAAPPPEWANTSTVMMRNLPNKYTQQMLLEDLDQSGFQGTFDFMYLPIDPETRANRGYAFINFRRPEFAWMLKTSYEGRRMGRFNSDKVVSVAPAALQGFEANYAHYSTARVNRGDPAARPLFLCESRLHRPAPRHDGRRRGGRRSSGSLVDLAARQQQQAVAAVVAASPMQGLAGSAAAELNGGAAPGAAAARAGPAEQRATPRFCPYCGGGCQPQFRFCQFCGASLSLGA